MTAMAIYVGAIVGLVHAILARLFFTRWRLGCLDACAAGYAGTYALASLAFGWPLLAFLTYLGAMVPIVLHIVFRVWGLLRAR